MDLKAAIRLIISQHQENPLLNIIQHLKDQDIISEFPDDVNNSIIVSSPFKSVLNCLRNADWKYVKIQEIRGGLYCLDRSIILSKGNDTIKLCRYSTLPRTEIWLQ